MGVCSLQFILSPSVCLVKSTGNRRIAVLIAAVLCAGAAFFAQPLQARELSLQERLRAQEVIERVYYSHQIGVTRPFDAAVPRSVLEKKVRTYLQHVLKTSATSLKSSKDGERKTRAVRITARCPRRRGWRPGCLRGQRWRRSACSFPRCCWWPGSL